MKPMPPVVKCAALLLACVAAAAAIAPAHGQGRAKGWVRESTKVIAALPLMLRFRNYLPEEVDLSPHFPTPGDQGQQSSCTAWATGYAARSYYEAQRRKWTFASPEQIISPAYIYNRLQDFSAECKGGIAISDALQVLKSDGAPTLSLYPYVENDCAQPATPEDIRIGSEFRISGWTGVDHKRLDDVKGQLAQGHPLIFGMDVSDSFELLSDGSTYDDTTSPRTGGHAMVIVGYSERRQAFKVMNSWGTSWGEGGFGWVSYRAVRQLSDVMFVMDVAPAAFDPPRPAPQPPVAVTPPRPEPAPVVKPPPEPAPVVKPRPEPVVKPQPQPPAPTPSVAAVQQQVAARTREMRCASIQTSVGSDRVVRLEGFTGFEDELAKLRRDLAELPGVRGVEANVTLYPWPQCEVFLNFADALKSPRGLVAGVSAGRILTEGDSLALQITTPSFPAHLYVTYLQANGDVVHLSWPQGRFPKPALPNTRMTFGGGAGGQPVYRITRPVGDEVIVVVASASPLFPDEPPDTSSDREYLTSFRKAFLTAPKGGGGSRIVSAVAVPLKTVEKP